MASVGSGLVFFSGFDMEDKAKDGEKEVWR